MAASSTPPRESLSKKGNWADFLPLARNLLQIADNKTSLSDFAIGLGRLLLDFSDCDSVELWAKQCEGGCLYCKVRRRPRRDFHSEIVAWPGHLPLPRPDRSVLAIPIPASGEPTVWLRLVRGRRSQFSAEEMASCEDAAQVLGAMLDARVARVALCNRTKELACLYRLAQQTERPGTTTPEMLRGIAELLPAAWRHPEIAAARIMLDGRSHETANFDAGIERQSAELVIAGRARGSVEVAYVERRPKLDEGPFSLGERHLLDEVARRTAQAIEWRQAAEEKSRLQDQLRHADRLATVGRLAAGFAHELNEPLGGILAFAQLAEKQENLPRQTAVDLKKIVKASLHAREIVKRWVLFARQTPPRRISTDLNDVVNESVGFLEARCAASGIVVHRRLSRRLPRIIADPVQLRQVMVNLLVNAVQAMVPNGGELLNPARPTNRSAAKKPANPAGTAAFAVEARSSATSGSIRIATRPAKGCVALVVEDDGVGMGADVIEQIFTPFFTTKDAHTGTGLGLSVVRDIVAAHGGTIAVRSQPGRGSRFEVRFPLSAPSPEGLHHAEPT